jgi:amidase
MHGVPFTVKDVYEVAQDAGLVAAPGISTGQIEPGTRDSAVIRKIREAGGILLGVSRATLWTDREERFGTARNPYDLGRTPGGSSGGEAVMIAAGCSPLGFGSDSGGSLRQPAHYCGLSALRPSNGRVPRATDAEANDPRTVAGPLARRVEDIAMALSLVNGFEWADPSTVPAPLRDYKEIPVKGLRVAMHLSNGVIGPTAETAECVKTSARALEKAGARVDECPLPELLTAWEITLEYWRFCSRQGSVEDYFKFQERWEKFRRISQEWMRNWDVILCPVEAYPAPLTEERDRLATFTYTAPSSLLGWPSGTVRVGASGEGLPIGVQLIAAPWRDEVALACMSFLESELGGYKPPPKG